MSFTSNGANLVNRYVPRSLLQEGMWAWGNNFYGQLGLNEFNTNKSSPVQVGTLTTWSACAAGERHSIALKSDGTLWALGGQNTSGQLGLSNIEYYSSPVQIGTLSTWKTVSAGRYHSAAIKTDGTLWTWGENGAGQCGLGFTYSQEISPVRVTSNTPWEKVFLGGVGSVAIKADGTMWAWGAIGSVRRSSSPQQVGTSNKWSTASVGQNAFAAIKTDGTLWVEGNNNAGQLGLSLSTASNVSLTQVGTLSDWKQISISDSALAIKTDGTLWAWGDNSYGQLGLNDSVVTHRSSPTQVGALAEWAQAATNGQTSYAIKTNGTLWAWGNNQYGQLGANLPANVTIPSPVQVGTMTNWAFVNSNSTSVVALKYTR